MNLSLEHVEVLDVGELARATAAELMRLEADASYYLRSAKALKDRIDGAIALKYGQRVSELRAQRGKDTGTISFYDEGIRVSSDLPKKPVWDQALLAEIAHRIGANGDDPSEFLEISYRVSERKYTAWPEHLRRIFEPARTLNTGKPTFQLSMAQEQ